MAHFYPSDISWEEFSIIEALLESVRKKTKPRTVDLHVNSEYQFDNLKHARLIMSTVRDSPGYHPRFIEICGKGVLEVLAAQQDKRNFPASIY